MEDDWESFAASTVTKKASPEPNSWEDSNTNIQSANELKSRLQRIQEKSNQRSLNNLASAESNISKEDTRRAEIDSDLKSASDLFGSTSISDQSNHNSINKTEKVINISSSSVKPPSSKADFDKTYDQITKLLNGGSKSIYYVPMIKELFKTLCNPLNDVQLKVITGELNRYALQKANENKAADKSKNKGAKTAAFSRKQFDNHDLNSYEGFDDDDFHSFM